MSDFLTKQDIKFAQEYVKEGNGTKAVQKAYGLDNYSSAATKANRLLKTDKIQSAINNVLTDEFLAQQHLGLFKHKRIEYFMFPKTMGDDEIIQHVNSVGVKVITVRQSEKGKMAFYVAPDTLAIRGALDLAYKVKGTYAPEKSVNVNIEVEADDVVKELTEKLNAIHRGTGVSGDGAPASPVDDEAQN